MFTHIGSWADIDVKKGLGKHVKEIIASIYIFFPYVCVHADKATKNKVCASRSMLTLTVRDTTWLSASMCHLAKWL